MSVCLSVCLSVCPPVYQLPDWQVNWVSLLDRPVFVRVEVDVAAASRARKESVGKNCAQAVERIAVAVKSAVKKYFEEKKKKIN